MPSLAKLQRYPILPPRQEEVPVDSKLQLSQPSSLLTKQLQLVDSLLKVSLVDSSLKQFLHFIHPTINSELQLCNKFWATTLQRFQLQPQLKGSSKLKLYWAWLSSAPASILRLHCLRDYTHLDSWFYYFIIILHIQ